MNKDPKEYTHRCCICGEWKKGMDGECKCAGSKPVSASALNEQVGGDHYSKHGDYQPWLVLQHWLTPEEFRGYMKGSAIVYLAREKDKGGNEDCAKAAHYLKALQELGNP